MLEKEEHLFERLARERNITVEEMRAIISARIEKGGMIQTWRRGLSGGRFHVPGIFLRQMSGCVMWWKGLKRMVIVIYYYDI